MTIARLTRCLAKAAPQALRDAVATVPYGPVSFAGSGKGGPVKVVKQIEIPAEGPDTAPAESKSKDTRILDLEKDLDRMSARCEELTKEKCTAQAEEQQKKEKLEREIASLRKRYTKLKATLGFSKKAAEAELQKQKGRSSQLENQLRIKLGKAEEELLEERRVKAGLQESFVTTKEKLQRHRAGAQADSGVDIMTDQAPEAAEIVQEIKAMALKDLVGDLFWDHILDPLREKETPGMEKSDLDLLRLALWHMQTIFTWLIRYAEQVETDFARQVLEPLGCAEETERVIRMIRFKDDGHGSKGEGKGEAAQSASIDVAGTTRCINATVPFIRRMLRMRLRQVFKLPEGTDGASIKAAGQALVDTAMDEERGIKAMVKVDGDGYAAFDAALLTKSADATAAFGGLLIKVLEWAMCRGAWCSPPLVLDWNQVDSRPMPFRSDSYRISESQLQDGDQCYVIFPPVSREGSKEVVVAGRVVAVADVSAA